ncbi:LytTR family transcriptional regulator [Macrococcoides bohemicum]|uniref:LytTR family transcriptional regulator n=1 Tax=Macrococcoides bohemicum TaxID=1903056 RepID=A0AAE7Q2X6_9STAP|nr:LytTR family DNA-binding domain-containing protein [Macrococcus bohemicus]QRN50045.1 LytTR family transcriptional regulator [Macrococcus bohemicus]QYA41483.1 LytTR family transcriptional regulator [Macrococcus bohemicus]QYA43907.1 LytTR family transcriptional regulator [Macrococcus bohemicus]
MKFNVNFNNHLNKDVIHLESHESNKNLVNNLINFFEAKITLIDIKTNKSIKVSVNQIESIESFTHLSKVNLVDDSLFYIKGRIKEFSDFTQYKIVKINNSQLFNLRHINQFSSDKASRLLIISNSNKEYIVSRYYSREIKEMLL